MGFEEIRSVKGDDLDEAAELIRSIWGEDPVFVARAESLVQQRFAAASVATEAGRLIGVSTLSPPSRHPHRFVAVDVAEPARRQGVGSALLAEIRESSGGSPLVSRLRPWDHASNRFFDAHGFPLVERAVSCVVDPQDPPIHEWIESTLSGVDESTRLVEPSDRLSIEQTAEVLARWYENTHWWSPPRPFTTEEATRVFVQPAIPGSLVSIEVLGRIVGGALLMDDPFGQEPDLAHLVFAGGPPEEAVDGKRMVTMLYVEMLRRAASMSKRVRFEVSNNHSGGWLAIPEMPVEARPELHLRAEPI